MVSPVLVVQVLPDECVRLDCPIGIHLRHIHVVNEVDKLLGAGRSEITTYSRQQATKANTKVLTLST